ESVARRLGDRDAVRAVDVRHGTEQLTGRGIDDHDAVLPTDEHTVVRRIGDDVVPAAVAADGIGVGDRVTAGFLGREASSERNREQQRATHDPPGGEYAT